GNAPNELGFARACLTQATCTWAGVTPAAAKRELTVLQVWAVGLTHADASCPLCAPSTITKRGFLVGSALAIVTNRENSIVVFDMPTEIMTILPLTGSYSPNAFSGRI